MEHFLIQMEKLTDKLCTEGIGSVSYEQLIAALQELKPAFTANCCKLSSVAGLELQVQLLQGSLVYWMDKIAVLAAGESDSRKLSVLIQNFTAGLNYLEKTYPAAFNAQMLLPHLLHGQKQKEAVNMIQLIFDRAPAADIYIEDLQAVFKNICSSHHPFSFRQWNYIDHLLAHLETSISSGASGFTAKHFWYLLMRFNCNHELIVQWLLHIQEIEVDQLNDDAEKLECLQRDRLQIMKMSYGSTTGFHPDKATCSSFLLQQVEASIQYYSDRGEQYRIHSKEEQGMSPEMVKTGLTVAQLALFTRLFIELKIVEHGNLTALLKMVAASFRTDKKIKISAESMRVRWYNPDKATRTIVREHLLNMLKTLQQW